MHLPRVRFTVRRMMVVVALIGVILGLAVEVPRLWRRWLFCNERAELFAECALSCRESADAELARLERLEAIIRRFDGLGPEPRSIASLIDASGDPDQARRWLERYGRFFDVTWGIRGPADHPGGAESGASRRGEDALISPMVVARWIEEAPVGPRRESIRRRERWFADYSLMVRAYRRAAARPWEPLPREIIRP